jgi:hypothetical protein
MGYVLLNFGKMPAEENIKSLKEALSIFKKTDSQNII